MDYKKTAAEIIEKVGGKENISSLTHCVTRLRFTLKDESKADSNAIGKINGVMGTAESAGQFQVIIGPAVEDVYKEAVELAGTGTVKEVEVKKEKLTVKGVFKNGLDTLISCFVPAIPVIAGSGMIKVLATLLTYAGLLTTDSISYTVLNAVGNSIFYFLPFFVGYNAAKKMNVDVFQSLVLAAILMNPTITGIADSGTVVSYFGLPLTVLDYSAQALPVIFAIWLLKYVDKLTEKYTPGIVKVWLRPMINFIVVSAVMLCFIGPVSAVFGNWLMAACTVMMDWGWLAVGINAFLMPLMVLTGTHNATIPLLIQLFATQGFDTIFMPCGMAANISEAGAAAAVAVRTKNKDMRSTAVSASLSALLGITEPALYGVNMRLKKPFIAVLLGALLGGFYVGFVGLQTSAFVTPCLLTIPIYIPEGMNFLVGLSTIPVCFGISFLLAYLFGFEDVPEEGTDEIVSPVKGEVVDLSTVNDQVFASKTMGEGFAVIPSEGKVYAPFDAEVVTLFPTGHAAGLKKADGLELLIHIGIDTVNLNGEGFKALVKQGDHVRKGQELIDFDLEALKEKGYDMTTMMIVTNTQEYQSVRVENGGMTDGKHGVLCVQ